MCIKNPFSKSSRAELKEKFTEKKRLIFRNNLRISPIGVSISVFFVSVLLYYLLLVFLDVENATPFQQILFKIFDVILTALITISLLDFISEIFSVKELINKILKDAIHEIKKETQTDYKSLSDNSLNEIIATITEAKLSNKGLNNPKEFKLISDICKFNIDELFKNIRNDKIYKNYTETINVDILNGKERIKRILSFSIFCKSDSVIFEKYIWFSSKSNRDLFNKNKVIFTLNSSIKKLEINNVEKLNAKNDLIDYGIQFRYNELHEDNYYNIEFEYLRIKPISFVPTVFTFRYYAHQPKIIFNFEDSEHKYDFQFSSFGNYKVLERGNDDENRFSESKRSEDLSELQSYSIDFDGYVNPGAGYIYYIKEKENKNE